VQTGAQNKTRVHFELKAQLKPLTADYLKRSERLEFRMSNMKETLFNQITKEEFDLIVNLGTGDIKVPRYHIHYLHIHIMVLNEMVIIFIHN
jgi:hypothetical protein